MQQRDDVGSVMKNAGVVHVEKFIMVGLMRPWQYSRGCERTGVASKARLMKLRQLRVAS
jgi:hypothetical protein